MNEPAFSVCENMLVARASFGRVDFRMRTRTKFFLSAVAIVLTFGVRGESDLMTTSNRWSLTWCGFRISPHCHEETELSRWAQETLELRSQEKWAAFQWGPLLLTGVTTPYGNWMDMHWFRGAYLSTPEPNKQRFCSLAVQCLSVPPEKWEARKQLKDEAAALLTPPPAAPHTALR